MTGKGLVLGVLVLFSTNHASSAARVAFQPERTYSTGTNPKAVAVGDFNRDGEGDLVVVNYGDPTTGDNGSVSMLFGNGDGTFQSAKNVAIGKNCINLAAGDFNSDGNDDLALVRPGDATASDDGDITVFLGNGDGTFRQGQVLTAGKNPSSLIAVDLNSDQRVDLVATTSGDQMFGVLLGNGDGSFQSPVAYPVTKAPYGVFVADLAGNGGKDLVVESGNRPPLGPGITVETWLSNGDGTFRQGLGLLGGFWTLGYFVGDFNADKKDDLVERRIPFCLPTPCQAPQAYLFLGTGGGTFLPPIAIAQAGSAAADLDGDGKFDMFGTSGESSQLFVMRGNGDGTFQQPVVFAINSNESLTDARDVNGDKAPDLVLFGQNSVGLLINVGTDFSISASIPNPSTLNRGQITTSTISLSLLSSFDNPVSLTCSVQPAQASSPTCSLNSNSVTFDGSGKASAMLTIKAGSKAASLNLARVPRKPGWLWFPAVAFAFLGTGVGLSRRRRLLIVLLGTALLTGLIAQLACGGGDGGPMPTAYTVKVAGRSGATQHSTAVNLTVQ